MAAPLGAAQLSGREQKMRSDRAMSVFRDIFEGFTSGFVEGAANHYAASAGSRMEELGRIERLCSENGWAFERSGDCIRLSFRDPVVGARNVIIANGNSAAVSFTAMSHAILAAADGPEQVPGHLLVRNWELEVGAWEGSVDSDGQAIFRLTYMALAAGLNAGTFKFIVESLVSESSDFDRKMQAAGLLRAS
jgi:hypothetical protein